VRVAARARRAGAAFLHAEPGGADRVDLARARACDDVSEVNPGVGG
jgi:hypothetical protein